MALLKICGHLSCRQLALVICSELFSHGSVENAVTGGWSLGASHFAMASAFEFEACSDGQRAMFLLDVRTLSPLILGQLSDPEDFQGRTRRSRELILRLQDRGVTLLSFAGVPKWRFNTRSFHFKCFFEPSLPMDDSSISPRVALITAAGEMCDFPDTTHSTIGTDHMWDIARRLREVIATNGTAPQLVSITEGIAMVRKNSCSGDLLSV